MVLRLLLLACSIFLNLFVCSSKLSAQGEAAQPRWLTVEIGLIGVASKDILQEVLKDARDQAFDGVVIILDTPGGALDATRDMVKDLLSAPLPLVVWVGPHGAHAGSAGAFITLAAPIAAMAPSTQIGAAHPIQMNGANLEQGSDLKDKVENDTLALMESIAKHRGRNVEFARSFVATSLSITAEEALENKVIDLLAKDVPELLAKIDGKNVKLDEGKEQVIRSKDASITVFEKSLRQRLLEILANPNLFYLLFIAGLIGLGFELTHPGIFFPGVVGAICLILALISTSVLPINFGGVALIFISIAFLVAELFVPSFGILGLGGLAGFVIGSVLLIDSRSQLGLAISWLTIAPAALAILGFFAWVSFIVLRGQKRRPQTGKESLLGKSAVALENFIEGTGQVRCEGEIWNAKDVSNEDLTKGTHLVVAEVQGLVLLVRKEREPNL